ncbi:hypothetical protein CPB85DRAFT_1279114 [Mucidula mucida]|nr:hypothetical protein CPB85DRAFT_1279114 [Mucidula mucida]
MPSLRSLYQYALPQQVTPDVVLIADTQPEGPPSYEDAASTSINVRVLVPAHLRPTNFVYVNRSNSSIKETCAINSALEIPQSLLPPLEAGETVRKNVSMISKNGSVNGTIHLLEGGLRADLLLRSQNGSVEARVYRTSRSDPSFRLDVSSQNGGVRVYIPRDFQGPIAITHGNGSVKLSDQVAAATSAFTDVNKVTRCFIGDLRLWKEGDWDGDELIAESRNGGIRVYFNDEPPPPPTLSFFSKLFS